jgi:hypothetical protein
MLATSQHSPSNGLQDAERTLRWLEREEIAVFPAPVGQKGSYVTRWQDRSATDAAAITKQRLSTGPINLAGRTGNGAAVFDLDAKNGVEPTEMLQVLRRLLGPAIMAIVRTSRGFHIWVRVVESVGNGFCSFIGGEIFSDPHLAMLPPSIHPTGYEYDWELEPRRADAAVNLKAIGLVPDQPASGKPRPAGGRPMTPASTDMQREFAHLMSEAGVTRSGTGSQTAELCPWHDDRTPSLSVNWVAAIYCCFSEHCQARGGVNSLRRRVRGDTPSYRQRADVENRPPDRRERDYLSGDKLGCADVDAATERLASGLDGLRLRERATAVRGCRTTFRVGKCTACARTPAFPISCSDPLCIRCMPGRLAADWKRHRTSLPPRVNVVRLCPRNLGSSSAGILRTVRSRFREWRPRAGLTAGVYGARLDANHGAVILLAVPSEASLPESSPAFEVEVVALDRETDEFLAWLQSEYIAEAQSWQTAAELGFLIDETKGRRRFQGFGAAYGESNEIEDVDSKEVVEMANPGETNPEEQRKPLARISGGSFKGKHAKGDPACPFCGGTVELYPFTVPAAEVKKVGTHWLWGGASSGPPEGRRYAR